MNLIIRLRVWFRQWRRKRASKGQKTPLREFVYLDEVSVYSLNASRLGSIAAEFTETQTVSLRDEIGSSLGASLGAAKADQPNTRIAGTSKIDRADNLQGVLRTGSGTGLSRYAADF